MGTLTKNVKILVVDDDEALRNTIASLFRNEYTVCTATSGNAALSLIQSQPVDIVISDVNMADGNGIELLQWLRARHPSTPGVVLVTGYAHVTSEEALDMGAFRVIFKPFSRDSLIAAIEDYVVLRGLLND